MDGTGAGTAIMLAVAAVLWFLYLVPTWLRRREYLATERTATRLQQTIRVLAETAELPDEVRVAVTAREAARQERLVRAQQRRADALAARQAAAVRGATPATAAVAGRVLDPGVVRRRRMRRTRLGASLVMLASTIVAAAQVFLIATTGMTVGALFVLVGAVAGVTVAIGTQRRLDAIAMPRSAAPARARTVVQLPVAESPARAATWTPVPTPRPMYLSRPAPESVVPRADLEEALRSAAAKAEATLRAAHTEPEVSSLRSSKYARMGVIGADAVEQPDLDEVLRRRRSAS